MPIFSLFRIPLLSTFVNYIYTQIFAHVTLPFI